MELNLINGILKTKYSYNTFNGGRLNVLWCYTGSPSQCYKVWKRNKRHTLQQKKWICLYYRQCDCLYRKLQKNLLKILDFFLTEGKPTRFMREFSKAVVYKVQYKKINVFPHTNNETTANYVYIYIYIAFYNHPKTWNA